MSPIEQQGLLKHKDYKYRVLGVLPTRRRYIYNYEKSWSRHSLYNWAMFKEPLEETTMSSYTKIAPVETIQWSD